MSLLTTIVQSLSPLLTPLSLLLPTPPSLILWPTCSINLSRLAPIPGCPSNLPLLSYNPPSLVSPSRVTPKTTLSCLTCSSPSIFNSQSVLISKTRLLNPDRASRLHDKKAFSVLVQVSAEDRKFLTNLSRIPIIGGNYVIERAYPSSPPNSLLTAGDLAMSNLAARTLLYASSAPALKLKQNTAAPTQPSPKEEISNQSLTAALHLVQAARTVPKPTRQATGTARPALYLPSLVPPTPQRQRQPPLLSPAVHLNLPSASCLRLMRMPWTPSQTKQNLPLLPP